jgi:hypothetical protein
MEPTQAKAEETPATAAPEPEAGTQPQPTLENANLDDLDAVQTEAAKVVAEGQADGGEGKEVEAEPPTGEPPAVEPTAEPPVEPPAAAPAAEPPEPSGEIPERFRFKDPTDRAIAAVKKAADVNGTPITWSEAERRVRGEPVAPQPRVDPIAQVSVEIDTLKSEIAGLEAQIDPADDSDEILSTKEMRAATVKLTEKRTELLKAELRLENVQAVQEGERLTALDIQKSEREKSKNRAIAEYPDAGSVDTPLGKAIAKKFEEMKNPRHPDHPILYADTAPERVTEIVAKELGIAPKPKTPTVKPAIPPPPTQKKATPVSGAKTAVPEKPAEAKDDKKSIEYLRSDKASLADLDDAFGANEGLAAAVR